MKTTAIGAAALALIGLAACQPVPDRGGASSRPPAKVSCNANAHSDLVGQPYSAFEARGYRGTTRLIGPGQPVTMDYNPDRLTIEVDENRQIVRFTCV